MMSNLGLFTAKTFNIYRYRKRHSRYTNEQVAHKFGVTESRVSAICRYIDARKIIDSNRNRWEADYVILEHFKTGYGSVRLARRLNMNQSTVSNIIYRKYRHL